uniref:C2H2-type domain-containing protein n=1 Tax=Acrobeloides nanus TaxID=290746 RepID=A0A914C5A8_9BILA
MSTSDNLSDSEKSTTKSLASSSATNDKKRFSCPDCEKNYASKSGLSSHEKSKHKSVCSVCKTIVKNEELEKHMGEHHPTCSLEGSFKQMRSNNDEDNDNIGTNLFVEEDSGVYYTYLLLDATILSDMSFSKFIDYIFYVGQGEGFRVLYHMINARNLAYHQEKNAKTINKIVGLWRKNKGIIYLITSPAKISEKDSLVREAVLIETIGRKQLTNIRSGSYGHSNVKRFPLTDKEAFAGRILWLTFKEFKRTQSIDIYNPEHIFIAAHEKWKTGELKTEEKVKEERAIKKEKTPKKSGETKEEKEERNEKKEKTPKKLNETKGVVKNKVSVKDEKEDLCKKFEDNKISD